MKMYVPSPAPRSLRIKVKQAIAQDPASLQEMLQTLIELIGSDRFAFWFDVIEEDPEPQGPALAQAQAA